MTTIEQLTLISQSPVSYNSEIRELAKCAANELEALRRINVTLRSKDDKWRESNGTLRTQNRELREVLKRAVSALKIELPNHYAYTIQDAEKALGLKTGDIEMKSTIEQVKEFHDAFSVSSDLETRRKNSVEFMWSELGELQLAENDVERLDALLDLQYMLDGTFLAYGWEKIKDAAFAEVHRSNMTKLQVDGTPLLRADGKVLKGKNYEPPKLEQFL